MNSKKELKQTLRLTDEMILIQGIVLIEQGARLMRWNNKELLNAHLDALETLKTEIVKECTKSKTGKMLYCELTARLTE